MPTEPRGRDAPTALVTGVGRRRGIGAATCRALIRDGWRVCASGWPDYDRHAVWTDPEVDAIDGLIGELQPTGRFAWWSTDLQDPGAPAELFERAQALAGSVQALVAAHARSLRGGVLEVTAEELDRHLAVNTRGTLLLISEFARRWRGEPGRGRIVTFISGPPLVGEIAYAASKGGVEWATLSAAAELASSGITVNAIDPGPTDTGALDEQTMHDMTTRSASRRIGTAEEAAELVAFLCSERAAALTGQVLRAGGR